MRTCDSENERTYRKRMYMSISDMKSINRKLSCAQINGFISLPCKRLVINVINMQKITSHHPNSLIQNSELHSLHFQKPAVLEQEKVLRLLRPWRDAKHFSTSKTVFINMSTGVDLSIHTL